MGVSFRSPVATNRSSSAERRRLEAVPTGSDQVFLWARQLARWPGRPRRGVWPSGHSGVPVGITQTTRNSVAARTYSRRRGQRGSRGRREPSRAHDSYLVDPASSHMLVSKTKPCMSKYKP